MLEYAERAIARSGQGVCPEVDSGRVHPRLFADRSSEAASEATEELDLLLSKGARVRQRRERVCLPRSA